MELTVANDGRVFYVERITGELNVYNPVNGQVTTAITIPVSSVQENGLMGIQLAPDFDTSNQLYVTYTPPTPNNQTRVSRFTVGANNTISAASEQIIFTWEAQREQCCHSGGSLAFAPNGDLYISTGDNTNPFASDGFTPIDERPGRAFWDAQRTSANSNNHNGKILRIHPLPGATGAPGIGTTYSIPAGNMFDESAPTGNQTLPEIYAMGFRNPFRITVDPTHGLGAGRQLRARRRRDRRGPRPAGQRGVRGRQAAGLLRLALLRPRQRPVQRLQLRDGHVG